ncbi:MAG: LPXTG cell wall anchor domain-containing protein [Cyanobacteria bacterium TGS_CYA1]|nr:LPXTG cell wall anchor domain-containing protein [Cyanobacteria bacterium TGS_CYA1]
MPKTGNSPSNSLVAGLNDLIVLILVLLPVISLNLAHQ